MVAILVCRDRECRATFEADGSRDSIETLSCEDCGGPLRAVAYADSRESEPNSRREATMRRAA
jgi:hypothetical protein